MARLRSEFLERIEAFCDRIVDVAEELDSQKRSKRVVDQIIGAGTSVGANTFEADEGMSKADFIRCLAIAVKELNEARFWIRLVGRRSWIKPGRLGGLEAECVELKKILGTMIARSKGRTTNASSI